MRAICFRKKNKRAIKTVVSDEHIITVNRMISILIKVMSYTRLSGLVELLRFKQIRANNILII